MNMYKVYFLEDGKPTRFTVVMADNAEQAMNFARGEYAGDMECELI